MSTESPQKIEPRNYLRVNHIKGFPRLISTILMLGGIATTGFACIDVGIGVVQEGLHPGQVREERAPTDTQLAFGGFILLALSGAAYAVEDKMQKG